MNLEQLTALNVTDDTSGKKTCGPTSGKRIVNDVQAAAGRSFVQ